MWAQVPGTAQQDNAEGFVIRGQQQQPERKQLWVRVNWDQVKLCCKYKSTTPSVSVKRFFTWCEKSFLMEGLVEVSYMSETDKDRKKGKFKRAIKHHHSTERLSHLSNPTQMDDYQCHVSKYKKAFVEHWQQMCWSIKGSNWQPIHILADLCVYTKHWITVETTNCGPVASATIELFYHLHWSTSTQLHNLVSMNPIVQVHLTWCQGFYWCR